MVAIEAMTAVMVFKILKIHRYLERFHFFVVSIGLVDDKALAVTFTNISVRKH